MSPKENEPLLKEESSSYGSSSSSDALNLEGTVQDRTTQSKVVIPKRTVIVEPVFFMFSIAMIGSVPVVEQYLYARFSEQFPILSNVTHDNASETINGTGPCSHVNKSDPYYEATQAVQAETSKWMMYLQVLPSLLSVFTTLIYGAYSDGVGRRVALLIPCASTTVKFVLNCFIIYFNFPVYCFLIGQVFDGLGGSFATLTSAVFAYIADITRPDQRGMRLTIAETCLTLAMAISQLGLGYFIKATGFFWPYLTLTLVLILNMIYLIFFVPETVVPNKKRSFSVFRSLKQTYRSFTEKDNSRNIKLFLLTLAVMLYTFPLQSRFTLQILFTMNIPLCWSSVEVGIYQAVGALAIQFGGLVGLKILKMFGMPEIWIAVVGSVSLIASNLVNAWAEDLLLMLTVALVGAFLLVGVPMLRSLTSRLVRVDEQGKVFSGVGCLEALVSLTSALVMNLIYQKTLFFMQGFVFIVSAMFGVVTILVTILLVCLYGNDLAVPRETLLADEEKSDLTTSGENKRD
ncbi:lysosomal proton-coupled steroid conjugate and bile acid symporter SLC46A3-like [Lineus longissimus]|uniref:lysosomal proton-coupled steroid conjugate and bile acid symporter SLC46A3-like n=1 Tax=Lineus longissimus TaxID=88925 RepID=UPI002B4C8C30